MTRRTSTLAVAFAAVCIGAPEASAHANANVAALQVGLRNAGLYAGPIDGLADAGTRAAVVALERRTRTRARGSLVRRARRLLGGYGRWTLGNRTLAPTATGWDVAMLQFALAWRGFPSGPFTGIYTDRTRRAVRRFQRSRGLAVDGVVGPQTLAALRRPPPRSPVHLHSPLVRAPVSGRFGPHGVRFHSGVDFAAAAGTAVLASRGGRVTYASWHPGGYGYLVTVAHGRGVRTMYAHLSRIDVRVGARVHVGQRIGAVGSTGNSTGPHLHFEVRVNGAAIDPRGALADA
jgi:murein DD-endopeptidase MepM/ murein hydrolase activator NlpD